MISFLVIVVMFIFSAANAFIYSMDKATGLLNDKISYIVAYTHLTAAVFGFAFCVLQTAAALISGLAALPLIGITFSISLFIAYCFVAIAAALEKIVS